MLKTVLRILSLLLSLAAISAQPGKPEEPRDIGSRLELFVDDYLIESMEGVRLKLHEPRSAGKVLSFDKPWEGNNSWQLSVFQDGGLYRLYYLGRSAPDYVKQSALKPGEIVIPEHPPFLCYAESSDGIHFEVDPKIIVESSESGWDSDMTEYVCTLEQPDRDLLFYCGNQFSGIGVAERMK